VLSSSSSSLSRSGSGSSDKGKEMVGGDEWSGGGGSAGQRGGAINGDEQEEGEGSGVVGASSPLRKSGGEGRALFSSSFIGCRAYEGRKRGYVYREGLRGLGYYADMRHRGRKWSAEEVWVGGGGGGGGNGVVEGVGGGGEGGVGGGAGEDGGAAGDGDGDGAYVIAADGSKIVEMEEVMSMFMLSSCFLLFRHVFCTPFSMDARRVGRIASPQNPDPQPPTHKPTNPKKPTSQT
jgi:hypothetical protein